VKEFYKLADIWRRQQFEAYFFDHPIQLCGLRVLALAVRDSSYVIFKFQWGKI